MNRPSNPLMAGPREYSYRREMTLEERLADERIVFLWGAITPGVAGGLIMRLLEMQAKHSDRDVSVYVNSPGGSVDDTLAIYDTMRFMSCDVATDCVGQAASGAAIILASGTKGKRYALPHSQIMLHQPWGGVGGQAADVKIQAEVILKTKDMINGILAKLTGQSIEKIKEETERDRYMSAEEARDYGLIDEVLTGEEEDKKKDKKKK